jgi:hypothetical protein
MRLTQTRCPVESNWRRGNDFFIYTELSWMMARIATIATAVVLPGFSPVASGPGGQVLEGTFRGTLRAGDVDLLWALGSS